MVGGQAMKKYFSLIIALVAISAVSCDKIDEIFSSPIVEREFTAILGDNTRTSVDTDGNVAWEAGDMIKYYTAKNGEVKSVAVPTSGNSATVRVQMEENASFFIAEYGGTGITDNTSGNTFTINGAVNAIQSGLFKDAHVAVAKTYLDDGTEYRNLNFKNITSIIKFTLERSDVAKIVFTAANGEKIHGNGTVKINFSGTDATPSFEDDGGSSITVNTNGAGTYYIATLPVNLSKGFTISCFDETDELLGTVNGSKSMNIKRNDIVNLGNLDSHIIQGATNLSAAGTANCYIVTGPGSYRFKAVQGNTNISVGDVKGVKVLWESYGTNVAPSQGDIINPSVSYENGYITFSTNGYKKGNAVIAAYDDAACSDGHVLWSWHIWCTDYPAEQVYRNNAGTLMDRHLGACSSELGNSQAFGLLYQWGRKDPFMGFSLGPEMKSTINESVAESNASIGTVEYATSHPTTVISNSNGNWLNVNDANLWSSNKTKYDPCPYGWKVPDENTWVNAAFGQNSSGSMSGKLFYYDETHSTWYPSTGNRDAHGVLREYGKGFCWANKEVHSSNSYFLYYTTGYYVEKNNDCHKSSAFGVRCAKDNGSDIVYVTGISLDKTSVELHQNEQITLQATVIPNNAVNNGVTWSSSNTDVATVDEYGTVTAIALGTATITANAGGYKAECSVTVQVPLSISLNMTSVELLVAERVFLKASTSPIEDAPVTWASSNTNIATVDETGKVTAISVGEATISASFEGKTADCHIHITQGSYYQRINNTDLLTSGHYLIVYEDGRVAFNGGLEALDVAKNTIPVNKGTIQQSANLNAAAFYYNSSDNSIKSSNGYYIGQTSDANGLKTSETSDFINSVSFSGNNVSIVSNCGPVLRFNHNTGQNRFRFYKTSSFTFLKDIQLYKLFFDDSFVCASGISINKASATLNIGESITIVATVSPSNASNSSIIWSSDNSDVASVDGNGTITAFSSGTTTITATVGDYYDECSITVNSIPATSIALNKTNATINVGQSITLTATVTPPNANNGTVAWSSNNIEVASVDNSGCVTAIAKGNATITASWNDLKAECQLIVKREGEDYIQFADTTVKRLCITNWDTNRDGELSLSEAAAVSDIKSIFKGQDITSFEELRYFSGISNIPNSAFYSCFQLVSITIPDRVTSIGSSAFHACNRLTNVTLPSQLISIGNKAFFHCVNLTEIIIPESVNSIGGSAFEGCSSLTNISIPNGITTIEASTFKNCSGLTSLAIPSGVTSIGASAFYGCSGISSLIIPNKITSINDRTFERCSSLESITIPDGVSNIAYCAFNGCTSLHTINLPSSLKSIGTQAFGNCPFTSIDLPDGVTSIGQQTFYECSNLSHIHIPSSIISIGLNAFWGCSNLTSLSIDDLYSWCKCDNQGHPFKDVSEGKQTHIYLNGVEIIELVLPVSVTSIGNETFDNCNSITKLIVPSTNTSVGLMSIGDRAFRHCTSLAKLEISESLSSIGLRAFENCINLTLIEIKATTPPAAGNEMFLNTHEGLLILVPTSSVDSYKSGWRAYANRIRGKEF